MGVFDGLMKKGREALNNEQTSDKLLNGAEGIARKVTKGKHDDKIRSAREQADKRLGDERRKNDGTPPERDRP